MVRSTRLTFDLKALDAAVDEPAQAGGPTCPLCDRLIPANARANRHHLTPKLKGGARKATVLLHQICHSAIHARFSEAELARRLSDVESLKQEPGLADFLTWIRTKPGDFHTSTRSTRDRRQARREKSGRDR